MSEGRPKSSSSGPAFGPGARGEQHRPGPPGLIGTGEKAKNFKDSFKRLLARFRPERRLMIFVLLLSLLAVATQVAAPQVLKHATNDIFAGALSRQIDQAQVALGMPADGWTKEEVIGQLEAAGQTDQAALLADMSLRPGEGIDFASVGRILVAVLAIYVLSALFAWLQGFLMAGIIVRTVYRLRKEVDEKITRLPLKFFDDHARGDILSRVTNDIDNMQQTMQQVLTQIITSFLTLIGVLAMMFWISWELALISLVVVPVSSGLAMVIAKRSQKQFTKQWKRTGDLNGHVEEMYTGHNIVKVFGRQEEAVEVFDEHNEGLYRASWKAQFISGAIMPVMMFVSNLNYVAVCVLGGIRVAQGTMTLGDVQAFIQYVQQFGQPIAQTASAANVMQSAVASAERVFEMLDEPEQSAEPAHPALLGEVEGRIVFDDVSFRYLEDTPLIESLDLDVKLGRLLLLSGPRCRQDDTREFADALLRDRRWDHYCRRRRHQGDEARSSAKCVRHGVAGCLAVLGHDQRQHSVWPRGDDRRRDTCRGRSGPRRSLRAYFAGWLRHTGGG